MSLDFTELCYFRPNTRSILNMTTTMSSTAHKLHRILMATITLACVVDAIPIVSADLTPIYQGPLNKVLDKDVGSQGPGNRDILYLQNTTTYCILKILLIKLCIYIFYATTGLPIYLFCFPLISIWKPSSYLFN